MKHTELRIGNWVKKTSGVELQVTGILPNGINHQDSEPIPLTEERLIKFGFKCVHEKNRHYSIITAKTGNRMIHIIYADEGHWNLCFSDDLSGRIETYPTDTYLQFNSSTSKLIFRPYRGRTHNIKNRMKWNKLKKTQKTKEDGLLRKLECCLII